jgi:hypothetical protein
VAPAPGYPTTSTDQGVTASPDSRSPIFTPERAPRKGHYGYPEEEDRDHTAATSGVLDTQIEALAADSGSPVWSVGSDACAVSRR